MIYLSFPNFNFYSMSLLMLILQGYIFAFLLLGRYLKQKHIADLFLALLLLMQGHHCTSYIIGFMGWYDTYRTTKVNYFLTNFTLIIGPLVYFYVKSITTPYFKLRRRDWWHFLPFGLFIIYRVAMAVYDLNQPGIEKVQNGPFHANVHQVYIFPFLTLFGFYSQLLYYAFSIQTYLRYRKRLVLFFSNIYKVELNWIGYFLYAWVLLFFFHSIMEVIGLVITDLRWKQSWWSHLASAVVVLFLGMKGYFTSLTKLYNSTSNARKNSKSPEAERKEKEEYQHQYTELTNYMKREEPYLDPDLTLSELARQLKTSTVKLSQTINSGLGKNFNDFINEYRVEAVKSMMLDEKKSNYSLLGIAQECGFNSKATFNRTFKKFTKLTPSEFLSKQKMAKAT